MSRAYWEKRSENIVDEVMKDASSYEQELKSQYTLALEDIRKDITDLYTKYGEDNNITYQQAQIGLSQVELSNYRSQVRQLRARIEETNDPDLIARYDALQKKVKLSRLQGLSYLIELKLGLLGYQEQMTIENMMRDVYESSYYSTAFMLAQGTGLGMTISSIDEDSIQNVLQYAWSGDHFSERVWDNKTSLTKDLRQTLTQGIIKGHSVQKMARAINQEMDSGYKDALRLARTESAYTLGQGTAKSYEANGIKQYEYLGTLDKRTSSVCRKLDGNIYNLTDMKVGVNYPPMHPNCRSTVTPHIDSEGSRRDNESGKIISSMNYEEWYTRYVK